MSGVELCIIVQELRELLNVYSYNDKRYNLIQNRVFIMLERFSQPTVNHNSPFDFIRSLKDARQKYVREFVN